MARRGALAQQLNAIESLASVDVICLDKTGTLTEPSLRVVEAVPANGDAGGLERALGRFAAAFPTRNATLDAVADAYHAPAEQRERDRCRSRRATAGAARGSATRRTCSARRSASRSAPSTDARGREAGRGRRVLALASTAAPLDGRRPRRGRRRPGSASTGSSCSRERLRDDARRDRRASSWTQGVELKVLSGDRPATVAAIAADAGIPVDGEPHRRRVAPGRPGRAARGRAGCVRVGRISPEGKRRVVEALRDGGRYVAMVGDGVNDVPALKAARLAIAQGSGAADGAQRGRHRAREGRLRGGAADGRARAGASSATCSASQSSS